MYIHYSKEGVQLAHLTWLL